VLKQLDQQILDLWKKAREKTLHRETARASVYRQLLREMWDLVKQPTNQPQELLEQIKNMIEPHVVNTPPNRAAAIRSQMIENGASVRSLMHTIVGLPFRFDEDHVLSQSFGILKSLYETRQTHLPQNIANPYAPCWQALIETDDRKSALCAMRSRPCCCCENLFATAPSGWTTAFAIETGIVSSCRTKSGNSESYIIISV
jgi:hypothetical protein